MIAIPGFSTPAAGADAPLEMLSACHARIERQCATLLRLAAHLSARGVDDEARQAATSVMRYFDLSAPNHHADEEQDLFPALLESVAGSDASCLRALIDGLSAEHRALEAGWRRVRAALVGIAEGDDALWRANDVNESEALVALYERHIRCEEDELLPMAARLLDDEALAGIGRAMAERRGL
ncbi:MAG: hypothetical protein IOMNBAOH_01587 [Rhodocyclaceae bacterium]|jgi:hemerythrin-like domain-containing protein|nr:hypothetical protein [Rhodocyclaceae bacterium]